MAAGYRSVYNGEDFMARFGGASHETARRENEEFDDRRRTYETARMDSAQSDLEYADRQNAGARATFAAAWQEIGNDREGVSPFTVARDYVNHHAKMALYLGNGQYDSAYREYKILNDASEAGGDRMFALMTSDPRATGKRIDLDLQTGAQKLVQRDFAKESVTVWDGTAMTADDLFRDGETYKKFGKITSLESGFTKDLVNATRGEDEFERKLAIRISSPVVDSGGKSDYALQFRDIGDYVFGNGEIKRLREELGDAGTERLVEDAMVKGTADGTYRDRMDFVRDVVWAQRRAGTDKDVYKLVRDSLDAFDRKVNALVRESGIGTDSARRAVTKLITIAAEESPSAIDLDDERVSARLGRWVGLQARAERFGIPLLSDSHQGGLAYRRAVGESFTRQSLRDEPPESSALVRLENAMNVSAGVFSAGAAPMGRSSDESAAALGYTSGDPSFDRAAVLMTADLLNGHILPGMYRGRREDVGFSRLSSDGESRARLAQSWGSALASSLGLPEDAGLYLASRFVEKIFVDGGVMPIDPRREISAAAFDSKTPESVAVSLRRYSKARRLVGDDQFDAMLSGYRMMLADPLVGWGMRDKAQIEANLNHAKMLAVAAMEEGADPRISLDAMSRRGYPFAWTDNWVLSDGTVATDAEYKAKKRTEVGEDGKTSREVKLDVKGAVPQFGKSSRLVDLDAMEPHIPAFGGMKAESLALRSWTRDKNEFLGMQAKMYRIAEEARKRQEDRASRTAAKPGGGGGPGIRL